MEMNSASTYPLAPYDFAARGWTRHDAAHLLRRTQIGVSSDEIDWACSDGFEASIDRLLNPRDESTTFAASDAAFYRLATNSGNLDDLRAWWAHKLIESANPLAEKMTLFWHGHFATSNAKVQSLPQMAAQNALFRKYALGDFSQLLHEIARDVAMLVWLDGNANRRRQPNENFARELMELFSLGVGNYTEKDIQEAARAFSGWHVRQRHFWLNQIQHDTTSKTVFGKSGNFDGDDIVRLCLEQNAAPIFLAKKLMQFFVMPSPPSEAIDELAVCIRENKFEMHPVLRTLFSSALFFSPEARHSIIKSPAEFVLGTQRTLDAKVNLRESVALMGQLGQSLFEPPTVEGWKGGRAWINSATMIGRANFAADLVGRSRYGEIEDPALLAGRIGWQDPRDALDYYFDLLLSRDAPIARVAVEQYLSQSSGPLGERLRGMLHLLLTLPEFQLM
jgi:uncharacterized protein (DUF1800 family)